MAESGSNPVTRRRTCTYRDFLSTPSGFPNQKGEGSESAIDVSRSITDNEKHDFLSSKASAT